jgi:hypothetical protein
MHTHLTSRLLLAAGLAWSALAPTSQAHAALVLTDDASFGSQAVVRDTVTGLEWLRLDFSQGKSFDHVASQLGDGDEFAGWSIASAALLTTQLGDVNGIVQGDFGSAGLTGAQALRDQICFADSFCKFVSSTHSVARGLIADVYDDGTFFGQQAFSVGIQLDSGSGESVDFRVSGWGFRGSQMEAVWLYRETRLAVPEPASLALLLAGATAMGAVRRRRRGKG